MNVTISCLRKVVPCYVGKSFYPATVRGAQQSGIYPCQRWDSGHTQRRYFAADKPGTLACGDKTSINKLVTKEDVQKFADITLDYNAIHLDEEFAKTTRFGRPVVHGMLGTGLLSGVVSRLVPKDGAVVVSTSFKFLAPMFVGEGVIAEAEVVKVEGRKVTFQMTCSSDNKITISGEAIVLLPKM